MRTRLPIYEELHLEQGGDLQSYRVLSCLSGLVDWSWASAQMAIRASYTSEPAIVLVTSVQSANGYARFDANGGILRVLTPAAVALLGPSHYVHDLWATFSDGSRRKIFRGPVTVSPTATR